MDVNIRACATSLLLLASVVSAVAGHERDIAAPEPIAGEIALTDTPFCGFFVIQMDRGFSLVRWRGEGEIFAEGDQIRGPLHSLGTQKIEHILAPKLLKAVGPLFTIIEIDKWGAELSEAQAAYFHGCFPERYALGRKAVSGR